MPYTIRQAAFCLRSQAGAKANYARPVFCLRLNESLFSLWRLEKRGSSNNNTKVSLQAMGKSDGYALQARVPRRSRRYRLTSHAPHFMYGMTAILMVDLMRKTDNRSRQVT